MLTTTYHCRSEGEKKKVVEGVLVVVVVVVVLVVLVALVEGVGGVYIYIYMFISVLCLIQPILAK